MQAAFQSAVSVLVQCTILVSLRIQSLGPWDLITGED